MRKIYIAVLLVAFFAALAAAQASTLSDARVGEWVVYQAGNGQMQERHQVIIRKQNSVSVKIDSIVRGKTIRSNTENYNINQPAFLAGASGQQSITAGGKQYNCTVVTKGDRTFYYSNQVPVTGLVAVERGGNRIKEIVSSGN
jgi:hypothetical protein